MLECKDIDARMMDWLYEELDEGVTSDFDQHVDACSRCQDELESFRRTREAFRDLPEVEPPPSLSAILLHEAAKRAPRKRKSSKGVIAAPGPRSRPRSRSDEQDGIWARILRFFGPVLAHPAAAAVACLVLVAGVAGSLYLRGEGGVAEPTVASETSRSPEPSGEATNTPGEDPAPTDEPGDLAKEGYAVRLADEGYEEELEGIRAGDDEARKGVDVGLATEPEPKKIPAKPNRRPPRKDEKIALDGETRRGRSATGGKLGAVPPAANVVSTADPLLTDEDADDSGAAYRSGGGGSANGVTGSTREGRTQGQDKTKKKVDAPPPADQRAMRRTEAERQKKDSKADIAWARNQEIRLDKSLRAKRCNDVAVIANDIRDRAPNYFFDNVAREPKLKTCERQVLVERNRRDRRRTKNRRTSPGNYEADMAEPFSE